jgi:arylsulfatase
VVPADTELTPRPDAIPAWDSLSDNEKKLYARQMEVYAGYQENADHNVGRLLDAIDELGELDNTLVIYIFGDNGASLEGTVTGSFNEMTAANRIPLTNEQQPSLIGQYGGLDAWGTDAFAPHYAAAWAWAGNTPFQWGKQVGSHLGGAQGMAVSWPDRIRTRWPPLQYTTAPTWARRSQGAGIPQAEVIDGVEQEPMHGRALSTPSTTPTPQSSTRSNTPRPMGTGRSTRTAGGHVPGSTASHGT